MITRSSGMPLSAGVPTSWRAKVTEQLPDHRIAWNSTDGATNSGVVTFHRLDEGRTRGTLQLEVEPEGTAENVADALGLVRRRTAGDLDGSSRLSRSE